MTRRLLQGLGVVFVLGLLGAATAGLMVVKDRVSLVVTDASAATGPDPIALLRDDLAVVARDLGDLRTRIGSDFERLGAALEERAEGRHADVRALAPELAAMRQQLVTQAAALERCEQRLLQLEAPAAGPAVAAATPPAIVESQTPVTPPVTAPEVPAAPAPKRAFLSFTIPATTFAFDREQRYQLLPDLCRVGFNAKSTLHDFTGVTSKVTGAFVADFDDPEGAWRGEVVCEAATLVTGVDGRDENMREHLDTTQHPQIRFEIERFVPAADGIDVPQQRVRGEIRGRMQIRGVTRELAMPVRVEVDASRRVVVEGETPLRLSDYQVPVPSQLGVINMQDEVVVWVALRARVQAVAGK